jgi:hypothetical protein
VVSKEDVARMMADGGYSQAEIVAAKIKLDESQAQARRAAVRYLASVNCHYYPEAESGLIAALRADRCECVRYEAALALGSCQCLTTHIVDALCLTAMGCETDGNPAENSPRVRAAAQAVLNRCLALGSPLPTTAPAQTPQVPQMPQSPPMPQALPPADWTPPAPAPNLPSRMPAYLDNPPQTQAAGYYGDSPGESMPASLLYERSRAETIGAPARTANVATGQRNLFSLFRNAANPDPAVPQPPEAVPARAVPPSPAPLPPAAPRPSTPPLGLSPIGSQVNRSKPRSPSPYNE